MQSLNETSHSMLSLALSRPWVLDCMSSTGFGERACKWVSIMLKNTLGTKPSKVSSGQSPYGMPDGQPAPVSDQHADDTTLHVLQPSDAQAALDSSIALFCAATCSQLNVSKSRGFLSPSTAPCLSLSSCPSQHQFHHRPTNYQASWGSLGL